MKKAWIIALLVIPTIVMAQAQPVERIVSIDDRLYDVFERDYLERLQVVNPFLLQYYTFFLDHSYKIVDMPEGKDYSDLKEVTIKRIKKLNILKLQKEEQLVRNADAYVYYRIKKTNKLLVLLPEKEFIKMLNQHLGRTY